MEKQPYHKENLREDLIEAGIRLINEHGFEGLSLRKIGAMCGVSHAAPYRHFASKEELVEAMQAHVEEQFANILASSVVGREHEEHSMMEFGKAYVLFFHAHPEYYNFFTRQEGMDIKIGKTPQSTGGTYRPFQLFLEMAQFHLKKMGVCSSKYSAGITAMWALVHGLAGLATMPGVKLDGDWEQLTETVLMGEFRNE